MKTLILTILILVISQITWAQTQNRMYRPAYPNMGPGMGQSQIETLRKENEELKRRIYSYQFCLKGMASDILKVKSSYGDALAAFAQGRIHDYDLAYAASQIAEERIKAKCGSSNTPEFYQD